MSYYISKTVNSSFDEAVERITASLKSEGFGILTEINVNEIFKAKLNVDFRKYKILGACNPVFAHKALQEEDKIGTMLPCSVIVQEIDEALTEVAVIDPVAAMMAIENPVVSEFANEVRTKLQRAIDRL
jgi:uncharacterized protein (DUF302 family)